MIPSAMHDREGKTKVMFVCLGNICRSPMAEGVFQALVDKAELSDQVEVASAGLGSWHIGEKPHAKMRRVAKENGIDLESQRAKQFTEGDLAYFTHIYAMDRAVQRDIELMAEKADVVLGELLSFSSFDPDPDTFEVPDPYFTGQFELVFSIVSRTCEAIFEGFKG